MEPTEILCISFNPKVGCFAVGTQTGFIVYTADPLKERFRRNCGGIGVVELLFKSNILAFAGGGQYPQYPPQQVMVWDDYQNRVIGTLEFRSEVLDIKMKYNQIIVVIKNRIYVYNYDLTTFTIIYQAETFENPIGLSSVSINKNCLTSLGTRPGFIHVVNFDNMHYYSISAHNSPIQALAMNMDGTLIATASLKGTLIRIFDVKNGEKIKEFRRGMNQVLVTNLCFDNSGEFLLVSSEKGTVHIYSVNGENRTSSLEGLSLVSSYFSSEWSFHSFPIEENPLNAKVMLGNCTNENVIVISIDKSGRYSKYLVRDNTTSVEHTTVNIIDLPSISTS